MTPAALATYIQFKGNIPSNVTPWTNANILTISNIAKDNIAQAIAQVNPDYFGENSTADTVSGQQEYTKPTDLMLMKRIDISYTDTNPGSYYPADIVTLSQLKPLGEDWYANFQPIDKPMVRFDDTGFFAYPKPQTGTSGSAFIRLWYVPKRTNLTDMTDNTNDIETTTGIGSFFHELIGDIVINQIKFKKGELTQQDLQENNAHILDILVPSAFRTLSTPKSSLPGDTALQY
ncbi:MAG TPA: hypothetical protein VFC63_19295 [Blastocatellia bacterium]|nr:hypothetical protein [Blastocatellia bacterium]